MGIHIFYMIVTYLMKEITLPHEIQMKRRESGGKGSYRYSVGKWADWRAWRLL